MLAALPPLFAGTTTEVAHLRPLSASPSSYSLGECRSLSGSRGRSRLLPPLPAARRRHPDHGRSSAPPPPAAPRHKQPTRTNPLSPPRSALCYFCFNFSRVLCLIRAGRDGVLCFCCDDVSQARPLPRRCGARSRPRRPSSSLAPPPPTARPSPPARPPPSPSWRRPPRPRRPRHRTPAPTPSSPPPRSSSSSSPSSSSSTEPTVPPRPAANHPPVPGLSP